jgi:hypothetical protein
MALFTGLAVAAFLGLESTFVAGAIAFGLNAAVGLVASLGLNYAVKALSGTPAAADSQHFSAQGTLAVGGDVPRSFQLGYSVTAGSLVYANEWGQSGKTPNAYHTQVIALQDIPGGSIREVWVNGEAVSLGAVAEANLGLPVTQYNKAGADHLWIKYYDGTQTTADPFLTSLVSSAARPYESTRVGVGVAYVICTALVDDTLFTGFPTYKFAMTGIPLYDIRKDSTAGGTGPQRWNDKTTWGGDGDTFPAVQIYNLLRGITYGSTWLYGLQAMTAARLPSANWIAQSAKCQSVVTGETGAENAYRSGAQISVNAPLASAIEGILTACQGRLAEIGGFYKLHLGAPDSPTFSWQDDDILSSEEQHFTPFFGLADSVNGISAKYPFPSEGWVSKVAPPYYRTDLEALDGNRRLLANPSFDFVPYSAQVQRLQKSAIQEAQRARRHAISLPPEFWIVEPGDIGQWTSVRNGYSNKQFRVDGVSDRANLDVVLNITEVDPADYSWNHAVEFTPITAGFTTVTRPAAQSVKDWTAIGITVNDAAGISRHAAIQMGWDGTLPGIKGVMWEIRQASDLAVINRSQTDQYSAGSVIISQNIIPLFHYQARGQYIPTSPRDMLWSSWIDVTTPDAKLTLDQFEQGLHDYVTNTIGDADKRIQEIADFIAGVAADQDAANRLDKHTITTVLNETTVTTAANLANATNSINNTIAGVQSDIITVQGNVNTVSQSGASTAAAFASYQTNTSATLGNLTSRVSTTETSIVTQTNALASYQTSVTASLGSLTSSVTTNSTAVATINGKVAASYTVVLDSNNYVSSLKAYNDGSVSSWTFVGNVFQIAFPGVSGGAPKTIFQVGSVNGASQVVLKGDLYSDGSIFTRHLTAGSVTAYAIQAGSISSDSGTINNLSVRSLSIADSAITATIVGRSSGNSGSGTYVNATNFGMGVDTTGLAGKTINVLITFSGQQGTSGSSNWFAAIGINGGIIAGPFGGSTFQPSFSVQGVYSFTASGGYDTFSVQGFWNGQSGMSLAANAITTATVVKR